MFSIEENYIREQNQIIKQLQKKVQHKENQLGELEQKFAQLEQSADITDTAEMSDNQGQDSSADPYIKSFLPAAFKIFQSQKTDQNEMIGPKPIFLTMVCVQAKNLLALSREIGLERAVEYIQEYFDICITSLKDFQGRLDKILTGTFFAYFGIDDDEDVEKQKESALKAFQFAMDLERRLEPLNIKLEQEEHLPITFGIGIHSGKIMATSVGDDHQRSMLFFGSELSLTGAIEGLNKYFNEKILVASNTADLVKDRADLKELQKVSIKDFQREIMIYSLIGLNEEEDLPGKPLDESLAEDTIEALASDDLAPAEEEIMDETTTEEESSTELEDSGLSEDDYSEVENLREELSDVNPETDELSELSDELSEDSLPEHDETIADPIEEDISQADEIPKNTDDLMTEIEGDDSLSDDLEDQLGDLDDFDLDSMDEGDKDKS